VTYRDDPALLTPRDRQEVDGFQRFLSVSGEAPHPDTLGAFDLPWWRPYILGEGGPAPRLWQDPDPAAGWPGGDQS
jgi:hypothetical protein